MAKAKHVDPPPIATDAPDPEPPDDHLRGIMYVWGQDTYRAWDALKESHPGWANILATFYGVVDDVLSAGA